MKLIRYIYPLTGKVIVEKVSPPDSGIKETVTGSRKNRIEIYNSQGELVSITTDRTKIKFLKLQKGFYLLKEMDKTGKVIHSDKLEL